MSMAVTDPGGTRMHVYDYDKIYQITDVNYPVGFEYLATDTTFEYDPTGNRTTVIDAGGATGYVTNALNQYTSVGGVDYTYDTSGNMTFDGAHMYEYDPENRLTTVNRAPHPLSAACDTTLPFTTGGDAEWFVQSNEVYYGSTAAQSGAIGDNQSTWMETTVEGPGTFKFWWKVSCEVGNSVNFYINGQWSAGRSGFLGWDEVSRTLGLGTHTLRWTYIKDGGGSAGSDCAWVDYVQWTPSNPQPVAELATALDTNLAIFTSGSQNWRRTTWPSYHGGDSAQSGSITHGQSTDMMTKVSGSGTLSFYWRVSSEANYDWLEFYIDGVLQDGISGEVDWEQKTYNLTGSGNRTLVWRYSKDGSVSEGDDRGWVDWLQWSGDGPIEESSDWQQIEYVYDPAGRRIEKKVDGVTELKFVYDGDHIIAEYDGQDNLLRKYVHGSSIDEPICLIESSGTYAGTHYYHYDALGSVIALSDGNGDVVQLYEYSVYGQVAASDPNHPNRFMFTGREFDKDTGLYYYRARYYNPEIGRFLQSDPIGYGDGMNMYAYCGNNSTNGKDPTGFYALIGRRGWWPRWPGCEEFYRRQIPPWLRTPEVTPRQVAEQIREVGDIVAPFAGPIARIGGGIAALVAAPYLAVPGTAAAALAASVCATRGLYDVGVGMVQLAGALVGEGVELPESMLGMVGGVVGALWGRDAASRGIDVLDSFDFLLPGWEDATPTRVDDWFGLLQGLIGLVDTFQQRPQHCVGFCPYNVCTSGGGWCPVCNLCPVHCLYPWTWGYCTVLNQWAPGKGPDNYDDDWPL